MACHRRLAEDRDLGPAVPELAPRAVDGQMARWPEMNATVKARPQVSPAARPSLLSGMLISNRSTKAGDGSPMG